MKHFRLEMDTLGVHNQNVVVYYIFEYKLACSGSENKFY